MLHDYLFAYYLPRLILGIAYYIVFPSSCDLRSQTDNHVYLLIMTSIFSLNSAFHLMHLIRNAQLSSVGFLEKYKTNCLILDAQFSNG